MKKIAITMGDPGGIGPEIVLKSLLSPEIIEFCRPVVVGSHQVIEKAISTLGIYAKIKVIEFQGDLRPPPGTIELIDCGDIGAFEKGRPCEAGGRASVIWIKRATELSIQNQVHAIVTAPISKEALKIAGYNWPGHTEMLAEITGTDSVAMMLIGGLLRVILVTIHTPIRNVPSLVTKDSVLKTIRLAMKACDMLGIRSPRVAIAGLNPHAGEAGLFGDEEIKEIRPAIEEAKREGIPAEGPYPPDIIFHKAYKNEVDVVVCMYHDQGLIPLKMIAFDEGVNITIGLPIIRTSPDHGTAFDIAWRGIANPASMIESIKLASRLKL